MTNFPSTQVNPADLAGALATSQVQTTESSGQSFMKFSASDGGYVHGMDSEDISGESICVNTASLEHGWILWCDGKPTKTMAPFNQPLPQAPAPRTDADGDLCEPAEARGFQARFMDDDETILAFSGNSYGARKGVDAMLSAIKLRAASGETEFLYPVVKLDSDSYKAKKAKGKTIFNPVFTIVDWANMNGDLAEGTVALEAPEQEEVAEEAPKRRRRKAS